MPRIVCLRVAEDNRLNIFSHGKHKAAVLALVVIIGIAKAACGDAQCMMQLA